MVREDGSSGWSGRMAAVRGWPEDQWLVSSRPSASGSHSVHQDKPQGTRGWTDGDGNLGRGCGGNVFGNRLVEPKVYSEDVMWRGM